MPTHQEQINNIVPLYEDNDNIVLSLDDYAYVERTEGDHNPITGQLLWKGKKVYRQILNTVS